MISDDLKHDVYAVNAFTEKGLGHLREKNPHKIHSHIEKVHLDDLDVLDTLKQKYSHLLVGEMCPRMVWPLPHWVVQQ